MSSQGRWERQRQQQAMRDRAKGPQATKRRRVPLDQRARQIQEVEQSGPVVKVHFTHGRMLRLSQSEFLKLWARTVRIECPCDHCTKPAPAANTSIHGTIWSTYQSALTRALFRHPASTYLAPADFADGSDELKLWRESAPNMGADGATEMVRALLVDDEDAA
jgi:hypothetical protein